MSDSINYESIKYFEYINNFLSISDIDTLLEKICKETPAVVGGRECSIFLIPDLVKEYSDSLVTGEGVEIYGDSIDHEFIVLARTTRASLKDKIGKAFYCKGQGLTGWIFEHEKPLKINDMRDSTELSSIDPNLVWTNEYKGAENHYAGSDKMPFLGVPLIKSGKALGVIRVSGINEKEFFSPFSSKVLKSFSGILSNLIENVTSREHLENSVNGLLNIGSATESVFHTIVNKIAHLVGANNCELYALDRYGEKIDIVATTGGYMEELIKENKATSYERGQGLTGWIFKTGKPLRIKNINDFKETRELSDADLEKISDGVQINDKDRKIKWLDLDDQYEHHLVPHPYFLGVPIISEAGEVIGVLRVSSPRSKIFFNRQDMFLLMKFAKSISLIFKNVRQNELYGILKEIGNIYDKDKLFEYVVQEMPKLVLGYGCSIFLKKQEREQIYLAFTSSSLLKDRSKKQELLYEYGQGKTGFVAKMGRPLLINYYGSGELQNLKMEEDYCKYKNDNRCLCYKFKNEKLNPVGIIRVVQGKNESGFSEEEKNIFYEFCKQQITKKDGGLGTNKDICETYESNKDKHALSFLAVPIKLKLKSQDVIGVIRIPRTSEGARFSDDDLALIESITGRLASAIEVEKATSKIREHLETLSSINSKINSPSNKDEILDEILKVLTDNDNLGYEFASIQLINQERNLIETIKCKNNPSIVGAVNPTDWQSLTSHPIYAEDGKIRDIHAYVLMEAKKAIVVKGKDQRYYKYLNKEIFQKHNHIQLVRAFVPIIDYSPKGGMPIGTIESGHSLKRKDSINLQELEMLKAVANQVAITIRNWEQKEKLRYFKDKAIFRNLSSMASAISHKMNNSIGLIKLKANDTLEKIDKNSFEKEKHRKYIQVILEKCEEALFLPNQLGGLISKIDSITKTKVDIDELITNDIIPHSKNLISTYTSKNNIEIYYNTEDTSSFVYADKTLLTESFQELIHNSIKAMINDGGTITIVKKAQNGNVNIYINDEGSGIPETHHNEIFSPGFSLRKSTGYGLWMCKNIINIIHEGDICLLKSNKSGTSFLVQLPLPEEK